ncbi:unnamed protein product [Blumeria hordei]|uniref:AAA+ ATPase domain-containing protein n=1 Tax=Blumeria hordei TaxID=2867405 RepID=A0A383URM6_BLUHO|nr:unnamed protein product [Blumeria hordei]
MLALVNNRVRDQNQDQKPLHSLRQKPSDGDPSVNDQAPPHTVTTSFCDKALAFPKVIARKHLDGNLIIKDGSSELSISHEAGKFKDLNENSHGAGELSPEHCAKHKKATVIHAARVDPGGKANLSTGRVPTENSIVPNQTGDFTENMKPFEIISKKTSVDTASGTVKTKTQNQILSSVPSNGFSASNPTDFASQPGTHDVNQPLYQSPNFTNTKSNHEILGACAQVRPQNQLQLNHRSGKIFLSPTKISLARKQGTKKSRILSSNIIKIKYPASLSLKINQILNSTELNNQLQGESNKCAKVKSGTASRPMHPFFQVNLTRRAEPTTESITSTKCLNNINHCLKPTKKCNLQSLNTNVPSHEKSAFYPKSEGIPRNKKQRKVLGGLQPSWPWKGMVHVRTYEKTEMVKETRQKELLPNLRHDKKFKENAIHISEAEDFTTSILEGLNIRSLVRSMQNSNPDQFPPNPTCLRLPTKLYESKLEIQSRLRTRLKSQIPNPKIGPESSSEDEIRIFESNAGKIVHPAILKAYTSIATNISAIKEGNCDSQSWTQKYAPSKANEVLQIGNETLILKKWLSNLIVNSVEAKTIETSLQMDSRSEISGKRKRKIQRSDSFVVMSDGDENDSFDELTGLEEVSSNRIYKSHRRTVIKSRNFSTKYKRGSKTHHTILISGPNGCGKSAAIYAAAKELNFDVFEINSSSRRSGKDIMEKIGDMTRNHHVQRLSGTKLFTKLNVPFPRGIKTCESITDSTKNTNIEDEKEIIPAKAKIPSKKSSSCVTHGIEEKLCAGLAPDLKKCQKQSLILIEEADIIFKEDGQFWATIENLVSISKRPVILTCNDETAVPLSHKHLHAILRFEPPPIDLAVDYMLVVAANEGHILKREAVKSLYEERGLDLRASLSELDFWCQIAVGDINKGLSCYSVRQYKDGEGSIDRVFSEGTYETGMGWISQDILESSLTHLDVEEEILHEASDFWNLDVGDWEESIGLTKWADHIRSLCHNQRRQLDALSMFENYTESMSDSDLLCKNLFGSENQLSLDPSIPKFGDKTRDEYPLSYKLIIASTSVMPDHIGQSMSLYLRSRARNYLQVTQHLEHQFEIRPELSSPTEGQIINIIRKNSISPKLSIPLKAFRRAFDPISYPMTQSLWMGGNYFEASQFNRTQRILSEDLAPYVRGIVAVDMQRQQEREQKSNLLSVGGSMSGKKRRTTRAAISALEGGARSETQRPRYFGQALNPQLVFQTGLPSWIAAVARRQVAAT